MRRHPPRPIDYTYVRQTYGVPAYPGVKVTNSQGKTGFITAGYDDNYVHVIFDGSKHSVSYHPSDPTYHP